MHWFVVVVIIIAVIYALSKIPFIKRLIKYYHERFIAQRVANYAKKHIHGIKEINDKTCKLFESMESVIDKVGGPILDLGCGSGGNVSYYPSNAKIWTIDLNTQFHSYLKESMKSSKATLEKHQVGNAEEMQEIFKDNTFSCVVCTKLLCCVDQEKTLREIMRVLKPGGRFYFLEHIIEKPWTFTRYFQILYTPLWKRIICGCQLHKDTDRVLKDFGFDNFQFEYWQRPLPSSFFFARRSCIGYGDKPVM
uniref:Methyltransferase type 11 domain-containing protein n=1 Tax=Clytia hemisphaerica TaxID=252671 RepID=A0A7M5X8T0_9CNID